MVRQAPSPVGAPRARTSIGVHRRGRLCHDFMLPRTSVPPPDVSAAAEGPHEGAELLAKAAGGGPLPSAWGQGSGGSHPPTWSSQVRALPPNESLSSPVAPEQEVDEARALMGMPEPKRAASERSAPRPANGEALAGLAMSPAHASGAPAQVQAIRIPEISASPTLAEGEVRHLRLEVHPPQLGACELELTMHDHALHAVVVVERAETVTVLRDAEPQVRQALLDRGIEVAAFDVQQGAADASGHFAGGPQAPVELAPAAASLASAARDEASKPATRQAKPSLAGSVDVLA